MQCAATSMAGPCQHRLWLKSAQLQQTLGRDLVEGSAVVQLHGRDWGHLAAAVPSKTLTQIKNYYQNYKVKVCFTRCSPKSQYQMAGACA